jgi:fluoroacetyl-CoA thioesterase
MHGSTPTPEELVGAKSQLELTVTTADTAIALGSGDVPVLATPRAVALVEAATVAATAGRLEPGITTVGTRVVLNHNRATPVGGVVFAEAELVEVDGRRLRFTVRLLEGPEVAAEGTVDRVMVNRQRFIEKAG